MRPIDISLYIIQTIWFILEFIVLRKMTSQDEKTEKSFFRIMYSILTLCLAIGIAIGIYLKLTNSNLYSSLIFFPAIGISFLIIGILIRYSAINTLKKYFTVNLTIDKNHKLITGGIYKYIRHPAYAGDILAFLGLGLSYGNIFSFILIALPFLVFITIRIPKEELVMQKAFGAEYSEWKLKTKRLVPFLF